MVNFYRHTRALTLIIALVIGATQIVGRTTLAYLSVLFTNPDGTPCQLPCLFGVRPGETSYQNAVELLRTHPFTQHFNPDIDRGVFSGQNTTVIVVRDSEDQIARIDLIRNTDSAPISWASLGQIVGTLGAPDLVGVDGEFTRSYYLPERLVFFHSYTAPGTLSVDENFEDIFVYAQLPKMPPNLSRWRGFSSIDRYLNPMNHTVRMDNISHE